MLVSLEQIATDQPDAVTATHRFTSCTSTDSAPNTRYRAGIFSHYCVLFPYYLVAREDRGDAMAVVSLEKDSNGLSRFPGCSNIRDFEFIGKLGEGTFGYVCIVYHGLIETD